MTDEEELEEHRHGFQWNWVLLSMLVYLIFYFIPLMSVPGGLIGGGVANEISIYIIGIWGIAGVFIISAIMAYFSPGVTVWEAVVSAIGVVLLMVGVLSLETNHLILESTDDMLSFGGALLVIFAMSYMGAWWGERYQNIKDIIDEFPMEIEERDGPSGE
jgi:hypothetical protein